MGVFYPHGYEHCTCSNHCTWQSKYNVFFALNLFDAISKAATTSPSIIYTFFLFIYKSCEWWHDPHKQICRPSLLLFARASCLGSEKKTRRNCYFDTTMLMYERHWEKRLHVHEIFRDIPSLASSLSHVTRMCFTPWRMLAPITLTCDGTWFQCFSLHPGRSPVSECLGHRRGDAVGSVADDQAMHVCIRAWSPSHGRKDVHSLTVSGLSSCCSGGCMEFMTQRDGDNVLDLPEQSGRAREWGWCCHLWCTWGAWCNAQPEKSRNKKTKSTCPHGSFLWPDGWVPS